MTVRGERMVRVATGERPDPHRGSRGYSGVIDLDGPMIWRCIRIAGPVEPDSSAPRTVGPLGHDGPLRVARRTKGERGEHQL